MTIIGIDTVAVLVSDRRKALQWFRDVLGPPVAYIGPAEPNSNPSLQGSPDNPGHWIELGSGSPITRIPFANWRITESSRDLQYLR
ncbi:MAG: hypothetical protein ABSA81_01040 [Candidatus Bathyarchaeia archaeon]